MFQGHRERSIKRNIGKILGQRQEIIDLANIHASARKEVAHKALENHMMQLHFVCNPAASGEAKS